MQIQLWGGPADGIVLHEVEARIEYRVPRVHSPSAVSAEKEDDGPYAVYKPWHRIDGGILYKYDGEHTP